jgi:hypothetical protein
MVNEAIEGKKAGWKAALLMKQPAKKMAHRQFDSLELSTYIFENELHTSVVLALIS